jgi:hypothetical protein
MRLLLHALDWLTGRGAMSEPSSPASQAEDGGLLAYLSDTGSETTGPSPPISVVSLNTEERHHTLSIDTGKTASRSKSSAFDLDEYDAEVQ